MRCKDIQALSSAYLDGELDADRRSAVRGHLRQCASCARRIDQERALIDAAAELEAVDPPDRVWEQIQTRLAQEEVRDSQRGQAFWLWRRARWPLALGLPITAVAALLLVRFWPGGPSSQPGPLRMVEQQTVLQGSVTTHQAQQSLDIERSDRRYLATIAELEDMVRGDRDLLGPARWQAVEEHLAGFEKRAIELRFETGASSSDPRSRDELHRNYRQQIRYLQGVLAGDWEDVDER